MLDRVVAGDIPAKHHIALRGPGGELRHEECFTRDGFDGPYTILYHLRRPHTQEVADVPHGWLPPAATPDRALAKRHYETGKVLEGRNAMPFGPPVDARVALLYNRDLTAGVAFPDAADPCYVANGDGDELLYIHAGGGVVRSVLGDLHFQQGDYVYIPRGMLHRIIPDATLAQHWLWFELAGGMHLLTQWRNEVGQLRMDAPYSQRDFRRTEHTGPLDEGIRDLAVKRSGRWHGFRYPDSPLDVVGWDGTVYPWAFPILAFQPRVGLVHLPPTWHGTFAARGALVCSFVPRPVDFHPDAIPCPYPHSSPSCDEIIFYCSGNFTSRRGVGPGSISHHPAGIPHGPHPGSYERSIGTTRTDELAVMLDCFEPLIPTPAALAIEDPRYHASFTS
jgi:homogentisate 1,2-dioxygenase